MKHLFEKMARIVYRFHLADIPSEEERLKVYKYIILQSINGDLQDPPYDDAYDGIQEEIVPELTPMQHADRCPPNKVSIDTTNPSTSMSCIVDDKYKAPQPEESPLELETYLHEIPSVESDIPIEI